MNFREFTKANETEKRRMARIENVRNAATDNASVRLSEDASKTDPTKGKSGYKNLGDPDGYWVPPPPHAPGTT